MQLEYAYKLYIYIQHTDAIDTAMFINFLLEGRGQGHSLTSYPHLRATLNQRLSSTLKYPTATRSESMFYMLLYIFYNL